jgi:hypothetical protein
MNSFDLIHIHPSGARNAPKFLFMPAGVVPLINEVRSHGYDAMAINEPMEMLRNQGNKDWSLEAMLSDSPAPLYSIDIHWHEHIYSGICIAELIKKIYPKSRVVVGGLTASVFAEDLLRNCSAIDYVISGYGEGQLVKLAKKIVGRNGKGSRQPSREVIYAHAPPDLDAYDYITHDWLLHWRDYARCALDTWMDGASVYWLKNGMGCSMKCAFCGGSRMAQKRIFGNCKVIPRSASLVAADIVALSRQGIQRVALTQDPNLTPKSYWRSLHREIRAYGMKPGIYIEAFGMPSDEFLADFAQTYDLRNSVVTLWPLCATESVRYNFGKSIPDKEIFRCLQSMRQNKIPLVFYLTRNLESPTVRTQAIHQKFIENAAKAFGSLQLVESYVTVDPSAEITRNPDGYGVDVTLKNSGDYITRTRLQGLNQPFDRLGYSLKTTH